MRKLLLFSILLSFTAYSQPSEWAKDTELANQYTFGLPSNGVVPRNLTILNDRLLFWAYSPTEGNELWVSDGTNDGTQLLKEFIPSDIVNTTTYNTQMVVLNQHAYFLVKNFNEEVNLWKSDGTIKGTTIVKKLPFSEIVLYGFGVVDDKIIFQLNDTFWQSDGTEQRTVQLPIEIPFTRNKPTYRIAHFGKKNFYITSNEIIQTDGNRTTYQRLFKYRVSDAKFTYLDFLRHSNSYFNINFSHFKETSDALYYLAHDSQRSEFSKVGLDEIKPTILASNIAFFDTKEYNQRLAGSTAEVGNKVYFSIYEKTKFTLWEWDSKQFKKTVSYPFSNQYIQPSEILAVKDKLLFTIQGKDEETALIAYDTQITQFNTITHIKNKSSLPSFENLGFSKLSDERILFINQKDNRNIWVTDGTPENTKPMGVSCSSSRPVVFQNKMYFDGSNSVINSGFFSTDGTIQGTQLVKDIGLFGKAIPKVIGRINDKLFVNIKNQVWVFNKDKREQLSDLVIIDEPRIFNNKLYFRGGSNQIDLSQLSIPIIIESDGTIDGTKNIGNCKENCPIVPFSSRAIKGNVVYTIRDQSLFLVEDGNKTTKIKSLSANESISDILAVSEDKVFFKIGFSDSSAEQIWYSENGKEANLIGDGFKWSLSSLTQFGQKVTFVYTTVYPDRQEYELWISDGTKSGTKLLKVVTSIENNSYQTLSYYIPKSFMVVNDKVYFYAGNKSEGVQLWVTDGTSNGTKIVKRITQNGKDIVDKYRQYLPFMYSFPYLMEYNNQLVFCADDGINGEEIWITDGTENGTKMLKDIHIGKGSSFPQMLGVYNKKAYFGAYSEDLGMELWSSDGTESGTILEKDFSKGYRSSNPYIVENNQGQLLIMAYSEESGYEMYKTQTITAIEPSKKNDFEIYPNPTSEWVNIRFNNPINEHVSIELVDLMGRIIRKKAVQNDISNQIIDLKGIPKGIYLINLNTSQQRFSKKIVIN
jgi:ELWxxDGT repeat protein